MKKWGILLFCAILAIGVFKIIDPSFAKAETAKTRLPKDFKVDGDRIKVDGEKGRKFIVLAADGIEYNGAHEENGKLLISLNVTNAQRGFMIQGLEGADVTLKASDGEVLSKSVVTPAENVVFNKTGAAQIAINLPGKKG